MTYAPRLSLLLLVPLLGASVALQRSQLADHAAAADPRPDRNVVRLKATADIWLSDAAPRERNTSAGKSPRFKLKSVQEMAAIRFDAAPARGREVTKATLFLRRASPDMLRYIRVSTVNQDWIEGNGRSPYGPPDGATYLYADAASKRPWAWPGSCFADVIMTAGNSLATWAERRELPNGWISVPLTPELIYALVAADTDGLAVIEGGNLAYHNNHIYSAQSPGNEPYIEVELGSPLTTPPARPRARAEPAPQRSNSDTGAIKLTIDPAGNVFCWRLTIDGRPVERWRIKHPAPTGPTILYLEGLAPSPARTLDIVAVSPGGLASEPTELVVPALPTHAALTSLGPLDPPPQTPAAPIENGKLRVWAYPGLVKIGPEKAEPMLADLRDGPDIRTANTVWDGQRIRLLGARGEYVSCQLCLENLAATPLTAIQVRPQPLTGPAGSTIQTTEIELYKNWYAQNREHQWQPAYCIPLEHGTSFDIPDPRRELPSQQNQSLYIDIYIPKDAKPGDYSGALTIEAAGLDRFSLPVELTVFDFVLPDKLSFWPELNAYQVPRPPHAFYRLAHQHRSVLNCWRWAPQRAGSGKDLQLRWDEYDRLVGPLLSGEAFKHSRRAGVPVECMYLPFDDSWPTPLSPETYAYTGHWPTRGEDVKFINQHYLTAPYIGDALSHDYKAAFLAAQRQFIDHFRAKGYARTEMQSFFGGKNTHRIQFGGNLWWTTDEPLHWDDWLALQFFCRLWTTGRDDYNAHHPMARADRRQWSARADISRPQWQARVLDGAVDTVYYATGAFNNPAMRRRGRSLADDAHFKLMTYGSLNRDNASNTQTVAQVLFAWTEGAGGLLPWQTLGTDRALDVNDRGAVGGGNALLVPGRRFDLPVVADLRLKALRDAEQLVEYLALLADRYHLSREQVKVLLSSALDIQPRPRPAAGPDNADASDFPTLDPYRLSALRRRLAELVVGK